MKLVQEPGVEPGTDALEKRCSIQLSYSCIKNLSDQRSVSLSLTVGNINQCTGSFVSARCGTTTEDDQPDQ